MQLHFTRAARAVLAILALQIAGASFPAYGGPGHDHGDGSAETANNHASPRFVAESEAYELVGVLEDGQLTIYLDRRATTEPVVDAEIELIVGGKSGRAEPAADGTYVLRSDAFENAGELEIVATIKEEGGSDLLLGTLAIPDRHFGDEHQEHFDHDHSVHHAEDGKAVERTLPGPLVETLKLSGLSPAVVERKFSNGSFLAGIALAFGLIVGALVRGKAILAIGVIGLVAVFGAGVAWAGPGHDHGPDDGGNAGNATSNAPHRMADGVLFVPKPTQRLLDIRTQVLGLETTMASTRLIGRVIADPNKAGLVQSTIGGRIQPTESGLPSLGQRVKAGEVLAFVEPAFAPIDASDVRQTAGDLNQQIALIEARIRRQQRLVDLQVASRANLEDLKIQLEGLNARYAELKSARTAPESLTSPVDGVIAEVRAVAGQVVESGQTIFHVLDPDSLWVEAISYDVGISVEGKAVEARTPKGESFKTSFVGRSRALQQQAVRLQFRIEDPTDELHIGSPVKVLVETGEPFEGLILPRAAIAQAPNGQTVAFKRLSPERYEPKPVRFESVDTERVLVTGGLMAGDQIIVRGAPLVNQIR